MYLLDKNMNVKLCCVFSAKGIDDKTTPLVSNGVITYHMFAFERNIS